MARPGKLPAAALAKLQAANDQLEQFDALLTQKANQVKAAQTVVIRCQESDPDELEDAIEKRTRLERALDDLRDRRNTLSKVVTAVNVWASNMPDDAVVTNSKRLMGSRLRSKGQTYVEAVAAVRHSIVAVKTERNRVQRCALPMDEKKQMATEWVNAAAARGKPHVATEHDRPFHLTFDHGTNFSSRQDIAAIIAWMFRDEMIAQLHRDIEAGADGRIALTAADRATRMRELRDELLSLERREEALIEAADDEGQIIARRVLEYPEAFLGVTLSPGSRQPPSRRVADPVV